MKPHPILSLCMIVRDEADQLPRFLEKHCRFFDEWIVIDTGSSDDTVRILKEAGKRPLFFRWQDDFSKARNFALQHASGDWVASMDADEVISAEDQEKIKVIIREDACDAISVVQRNYSEDMDDILWVPCSRDPEALGPFHQGATGFIPVPIVRFFRRRPEYCWEYPVHEVLQPSIERAGGSILDTPYIIHHYGLIRTENRLKRKHALYARIAANLKGQGCLESSPKLLCELAKASESDIERLKLLETARGRSSKDPYFLVFLGDAQLRAGRLDQALSTATILIESKPDMPAGFLLAAKVCYRMNHSELGMDLLRRSLPRHKHNPKILYSLGMLYFVSKKIRPALFYLRRAREQAPSDRAIQNDLRRVETLAPDLCEKMVDGCFNG